MPASPKAKAQQDMRRHDFEDRGGASFAIGGTLKPPLHVLTLWRGHGQRSIIRTLRVVIKNSTQKCTPHLKQVSLNSLFQIPLL